MEAEVQRPAPAHWKRGQTREDMLETVQGLEAAVLVDEPIDAELRSGIAVLEREEFRDAVVPEEVERVNKIEGNDFTSVRSMDWTLSNGTVGNPQGANRTRGR